MFGIFTGFFEKLTEMNGASQKNYSLNPHRHVKIWLSKDSNVFLNKINQLRLVKMRHQHPDDEIHFVYDSQLLSPTALENMMVFCNKQNLVPCDIRKEIIPLCQTIEEKNLIQLYNDEVAHLNEGGGNLGAASDILRWLRPIYSLGIYSDFDVEVFTKNLPNEINVHAPVLLNIKKVNVDHTHTNQWGQTGLLINGVRLD